MKVDHYLRFFGTGVFFFYLLSALSVGQSVSGALRGTITDPSGAAIAGASDAEFAKTWTLLNNGQKLMAMPKAACIRGFVMNHLIHHRAQLGVYLRLNNVPVPAIYGPSADEGAF